MLPACRLQSELIDRVVANQRFDIFRLFPCNSVHSEHHRRSHFVIRARSTYMHLSVLSSAVYLPEQFSILLLHHHLPLPSSWLFHTHPQTTKPGVVLFCFIPKGSKRYRSRYGFLGATFVHGGTDGRCCLAVWITHSSSWLLKTLLPQLTFFKKILHFILPNVRPVLQTQFFV